MLTLAAGGLALAVTFLEKIAPNPLPDTLWLIACSWGGFITSLFAILASFQMSQWACCRQRNILDHKLMGTLGQQCDERNRWARCTHRLNVTSYVCFLMAVVFLTCFSWRNIPNSGSKNVADQDKPKVENRDDCQKTGAGVIPPKAPATPASPTSENKLKPPQAIHKDATGMVINPTHLVRDIHAHFDKYMADVKNPANGSLRANFNKRAEEIERSIVGTIAVSGAIPLSTSIPTTGTPNPMMSGPPLPPPWGS